MGNKNSCTTKDREYHICEHDDVSALGVRLPERHTPQIHHPYKL